MAKHRNLLTSGTAQGCYYSYSTISFYNRVGGFNKTKGEKIIFFLKVA